MKYKLEIVNKKGILLAKFETISKTIFDEIVSVLNDQNLIEELRTFKEEATKTEA